MSHIPPLPHGAALASSRDLPPHLLQNQDPSSSYSPSASAASSPTYPTVIPVPDDDGGGYEDEENIFKDMSFDEILEDLNARFLINLPKEEMNLLRVYWQAEQAHWFYEDYLRPLNPSLPSLSQRQFTRLIIESSPMYKQLIRDGGVDYDGLWDEYRSYKRMVPCCGGIMINESGDKALLVRGFKSTAGWSFPRGKINLNETEEACAIREVHEETGFDLEGMVNPADKIKTHINAQEVTMFIVKGIDEETVFETQTRNEIGAIEWVRLVDLPTWGGKRPKKSGKAKRFYNVTPFVNPLKAWLKAHGINPHAKPKPNKQPKAPLPYGASGSPAPAPAHPAYRDLQPFQFDAFASPSPTPPSPAPTAPSRGASALDQLFSKFIHKQEEEILAPSEQSAVGSDNKAGLERLFGNLDVLKEEEDAQVRREAASHEDKEREKKEDDALARLLGDLGRMQTPGLDARKLAPATQRQNHLLGMLNQRPQAQGSGQQATIRGQGQGQTVRPSPLGDGSAGSSAAGTPAKPHQAKLLAMISPQQNPPSPSRLPAYPTDQPLHAHHSPYATPTHIQAQTQPQTSSLPTSPRPPSAPHEVEEAQRQAKARMLLDMTIAGMGIDVPGNPSAVDLSHAAVHMQTAGGGGRGGQQLTPPEHGKGYPPAGVHQPQQQQPGAYPVPPHGGGYRSTSQQHQQALLGQLGQRPPQPPQQPAVPGGVGAGYTGSPRTSQPPPPYEASVYHAGPSAQPPVIPPVGNPPGPTGWNAAPPGVGVPPNPNPGPGPAPGPGVGQAGGIPPHHFSPPNGVLPPGNPGMGLPAHRMRPPTSIPSQQAHAPNYRPASQPLPMQGTYGGGGPGPGQGQGQGYLPPHAMHPGNGPMGVGHPVNLNHQGLGFASPPGQGMGAGPGYGYNHPPPLGQPGLGPVPGQGQGVGQVQGGHAPQRQPSGPGPNGHLGFAPHPHHLPLGGQHHGQQQHGHGQHPHPHQQHAGQFQGIKPQQQQQQQQQQQAMQMGAGGGGPPGQAPGLPYGSTSPNKVGLHGPGVGGAGGVRPILGQAQMGAGQHGQQGQQGQQGQGAPVNVYHPVPRPPVGSAGLLAMLNNGAGQGR